MAVNSETMRRRLREKGFVIATCDFGPLDDIMICRIVPVEGEQEFVKTTYRALTHRGGLGRKWPLIEGYKYVHTIVKEKR